MTSKPRSRQAESQTARGFGDPIRAISPNSNYHSARALSEFIQSTSAENDILLDPFSAGGASAIQALRLGRRAVLLELNPVTAFFAEVLLRPASLPRLQWGFQDVGEASHEALADLYPTGCPKCGKRGVMERIDTNNGKAGRIEYSCACSPKRLAKEPDAEDRRAQERIPDLEIPFWYPAPQPLAPKSVLRYPPDGLNRRTVAALSVILHAIENLTASSTHAVLLAAFAITLEFLHPAARSPDGLDRRTVRAHTEINPWRMFERSFVRIYAAKKETNRLLRQVEIGRSFAELASGHANVVLLPRPAPDSPDIGIPERSVDGVAAVIPSDTGGQKIPLTEIQAAWLRIGLDYARDIIPDSEPDASRQERYGRIRTALRATRSAVKTGSAIRFHYPERSQADLHGVLRELEQSGLAADRIHFQPDPDARGIHGGYILSTQIGRPEPTAQEPVAEAFLAKKLAAAIRSRFLIHGPKATAENTLHAFYQQLNAAEIASISRYSIEDFFAKAVEPFARFRDGKLTFPKAKSRPAGKRARSGFGRRTVLDAELLASGGGEASRPAWESAIARLSRGELTLEDAAFLRRGLGPAQIASHRRKHAADLLVGWGRSLGHQTRASKNASAILWKTSPGRTIDISLGKEDLRIASRSKNGAVAKWGELSYPALESALSEWCRRHPDREAGLAERLILPDGLLHAGKAFAEEKPSPAKEHNFKVLQNRKICDRHYLMTVELPKGADGDFLPGQFFHILCDPAADRPGSQPLTLRRPLSIHRARYPGFDPAALAWAEDLPDEIRSALVRHPDRIDFLYRVVGEGTELLSRTRKGAVLNAIGPCGNGFSIGEARTAVIVAGGIGIAPLAALAEQLRCAGKEVLVYLGAVAMDMLSLAVTRNEPEDGERGLLDAIESEFREIGARVQTVCTDDGSIGEKGFVTEMLEAGIRGGCVPKDSVRLYACGPEGMLRAVADISARHGLDCQVSLEQRMACGIGACYACTVSVLQEDGSIGKKRVCREGPVFHARDIQWKD